MKNTKAEYLRNIVEQYRKSGEEYPATGKMIAAWAIRKSLWEAPPRSKINQCAAELAHAMRDDYFVDPQGRRVRRKHVFKKTELLPDGREEQLLLWIDINDATPQQMHGAFQLRRHWILDDCHQLKIDADSYNDNNSDGAKIEPVFDFRDDLAELEMASEDAA